MLGLVTLVCALHTSWLHASLLHTSCVSMPQPLRQQRELDSSARVHSRLPMSAHSLAASLQLAAVPRTPGVRGACAVPLRASHTDVQLCASQQRTAALCVSCMHVAPRSRVAVLTLAFVFKSCFVGLGQPTDVQKKRPCVSMSLCMTPARMERAGHMAAVARQLVS